MKKINLFKRIGDYLKEIKGELKKVTWPTKDDLIKTTIAVLVSSLIFGVFLFIIDMIFSRVINSIIGVFQ
ncbi:MAG: preprotein translocase subunit SecE [Candidatus Aminicenantes bacterium]|nr:preprotein translocase subunit SecE [Candidatus Aminicenantes bacterium]